MNETWLPVAGFEGYLEVSDQGQIRSLDRLISMRTPTGGTYKRIHQGRILKQSTHPRRGYKYVMLAGGGKVRRNKKVHHVVLEAFVGPRPEGMECCHANDIPGDNRLTNLRWDTPASNGRDRRANRRGLRTHCKRNHEFTPENTMPLRGGGRRCRQCHYERRRAA